MGPTPMSRPPTRMTNTDVRSSATALSPAIGIWSVRTSPGVSAPNVRPKLRVSEGPRWRLRR